MRVDCQRMRGRKYKYSNKRNKADDRRFFAGYLHVLRQKQTTYYCGTKRHNNMLNAYRGEVKLVDKTMSDEIAERKQINGKTK